MSLLVPRDGDYTDTIIERQRDIRLFMETGDLMSESFQDTIFAYMVMSYLQRGSWDRYIWSQIYANVNEIRREIPQLDDIQNNMQVVYKYLIEPTSKSNQFLFSLDVDKIVTCYDETSSIVDLEPESFQQYDQYIQFIERDLDNTRLEEFEKLVFGVVKYPYLTDTSFTDYIRKNLIVKLGFDVNTFTLDDIEHLNGWEVLALRLIYSKPNVCDVESLFISDYVDLNNEMIDITSIPKYNVTLLHPIMKLEPNPRYTLDQVKKEIATKVNIKRRPCYNINNMMLNSFFRVLPFYKNHIIYSNGDTRYVNVNDHLKSSTLGYLQYAKDNLKANGNAIAYKIDIEQLKLAAVIGSTFELQLTAMALLRIKCGLRTNFGPHLINLPSIDQVELWIPQKLKSSLISLPKVETLQTLRVKEQVALIDSISRICVNRKLCSIICSSYYLPPVNMMEVYKSLSTDAHIYIFITLLLQQYNCQELFPKFKHLNPKFGKEYLNMDPFAHYTAPKYQKRSTRTVELGARYNVDDEEVMFSDPILNSIVEDKVDLNTFSDKQYTTLLTLLATLYMT